MFMMCHRIGLPPISTIGLGRKRVSSDKRVPNPPAKMTAFIRSLLPGHGGRNAAMWLIAATLLWVEFAHTPYIRPPQYWHTCSSHKRALRRLRVVKCTNLMWTDLGLDEM